MKRCLPFLLVLLAGLPAAGQIAGDTLAPAEVKARKSASLVKESFGPGVKITAIDSSTRGSYHSESLATLLAGATTAFVKSYGFNSFTTLSLRGASAAQTAVYWEGVPLQNGATGLTDISLLPVALLDGISLDYGGSAALYGSGNVGGAVMLRQEKPLFTDSLSFKSRATLGFGSFGRLRGDISAQMTSKRVCLSVSGQAFRAENNFSATDDRGHAFTTEHAAQRALSGMLTAGWKLSARNTLAADAWLQSYRREIPRALFESASQKDQYDADSRFLLHWQHNGRRAQVYTRTAFFSNEYRYADSFIQLYAALRTRQAFAEAGWTGHVSKGGKLLLFTPLQYFFLDGAAGSPAQARVALAAAYSHNLLQDRLILAGNFRAESFDGTVILLPGGNASFALSKSLRLRANAQRTYRAPTLNELYYQPGGNPDLKPEQGWSYDGGYDWQPHLSSGTHLSHSLSAYNRHIRDWIIWLGGAIWTPHNLAAVHSRGLETENAISGKWRSTTWRAGLNAAYTLATPTESYLSGDNSIGRQIPYVPRITAAGLLGLGWKAFYGEVSANYTGRRYIVSDESDFLDPFIVGNLRLRYAPKIGNLPLVVQLAVNNIWNTSYAVVGYRPMPGVNYTLNLGFQMAGRW